jgi:hypothetical protein
MSASKANEHVEQAEKKLKSWGMFGNKVRIFLTEITKHSGKKL